MAFLKIIDVYLRPGIVHVLHLRQIMIAQPAKILQIPGRPDQPPKPLMVVVKSLIGIIPRLGRKQEKRPIAPLQQKEFAGHLAEEAWAAVIGRAALVVEKSYDLVPFPASRY